MADPHDKVVKDAEHTHRELGKMIDGLGGVEHPKGDISAAYRAAHREVRDIAKREAWNEIPEAMESLQGKVSGVAGKAVRAASALGIESARIQFGVYDIEIPEEWEDPATTYLEDAWSNVVRQQISSVQAAIAARPDPIILLGDKTRQGLIRPGPVIAAGAGFMAAALASAWALTADRGAKKADPRADFRRQAIAAVDQRTTDCCLRVHGQVVKMDQPFHLSGTPRYGDRIMSPPFHDY
jgi:hypothetical protein